MEMNDWELSAYILINEDEKLSGSERNGYFPSADASLINEKVKKSFLI